MGPTTLTEGELQLSPSLRNNELLSPEIHTNAQHFSNESMPTENFACKKNIRHNLDTSSFRPCAVTVEANSVAISPLTLSPSLSPSKINNVTWLDLSNQGLQDFPPIEDLPSLLFLNVSRNSIKELPSMLKSAIRLRVLDISYNQLQKFPSLLINNLAMIKTLTLSHNFLHSLPKPSCFQHLKELNVSSCQIWEFPQWIIFDRHWLEILDLSNNPVFFMFVPNERACYHASMQLMKKLNLADTKMTDRFNCILRRFTNLKELDISNYKTNFHNQFTILEEGLPDSLETLKAININVGCNPTLRNTSLVNVDLSQNPLSWIDSNFVTKTLKTVVISRCSVCFLPDDLGDMEQLESLDLSYNDISVLPASFSSLSRLKCLDLYSNSLSSFPNVLQQIPSLNSLDLCHNHFDPLVPPLELNQLSYIELRTSLRATLSESRACGPSQKLSSTDDELPIESYWSSSTSEYDDHEGSEKNSDIQAANSDSRLSANNSEEENWDCPDEDRVCNSGVSELNCPIGPSYLGADSNLFFRQYLHLVPERIRRSPFYYHRIDLSQQLTLPQPKSVDDYVAVEGQFDD